MILLFKLVQILALILFTFTQYTLCKTREELRRVNRCNVQCGGWEAHEQASRNGEIVCYTDKNGRREANRPCFVECLGLQPDEDQTRCMCDFCKRDDWSFVAFCLKPQTSPLQGRNDCDLVCTGEANFWGEYCAEPVPMIKF